MSTNTPSQNSSISSPSRMLLKREKLAYLQNWDALHLYFLEPIGIGTPFTESISSYLARLAQEHCLPLKKLVMGEIAPASLGDRYQPEMLSKNVSTLLGNSDANPAINGMREMTRSLVKALEQLTLRQDLRYLSCLTYEEVIKDRSLLRQHKAWCPHCFQQQLLEK